MSKGWQQLAYSRMIQFLLKLIICIVILVVFKDQFGASKDTQTPGTLQQILINAAKFSAFPD